MDPLSLTLGIGGLLGNLFGNIFGAKKQSDTAEKTTGMQIAANTRAAELEKQALDEALAYQKQIDARDYNDWLRFDERDRRDWEAKEQRRAPYRALGDSAVRTLADYISVPGMKPAQEVPVQVWNGGQPAASSSGMGQPTSNTMPVTPSLADTYLMPPDVAQGPLARAGWDNTAPTSTLLAKYKRPSTLRDLIA